MADRKVDGEASKRLEALADAFELLRVATSFPQEPLARAVSDGALAADARGCLEDCGVDPDGLSVACASWEALRGSEPGGLWASMRRGHSLLHMRQGSGVAVWPYESAFVHARTGKRGEPALFRTHVTLAVETCMREAGVLPADRLTEPCDSVWDECSFVSYLLAGELEALAQGDAARAGLCRTRLQAFVREHVLVWFPGYFDEVRGAVVRLGMEEPAASYYRGLAAFGCQAVELLAGPGGA